MVAETETGGLASPEAATNSRARALDRPDMIFLLQLVVSVLFALMMPWMRDALNTTDPSAFQARTRVALLWILCVLVVSAAAWLVGRRAGWMVLPGLAGYLFLYDAIEPLFYRWGMENEGAPFLWPIVIVMLVLGAPAIYGIRVHLGNRAASFGAVWMSAFWVGAIFPWLPYVWIQAEQFEANARATYDYSHSDPSLSFVAAAFAVMAAGLIRVWKRRQPP